MDTRGFLREVREHLVRGDAALEAKLRLDEWVYGPGLPTNAVRPETDRFARVEAQARRFLEGAQAASLATQGWTTQEWQYFLGVLPRALTPAQLAALDAAFGLTRTGNSEVLFLWLEKAIANRYEPALPVLERFLTSQGRGKFVRPLYAALAATPWGAAEARRIFARARERYHASVAAMVEAVLG